MSFYDCGLGDRLVEDGMYPTEIKEFLVEEALLLERVESSFDLLVEVGCMQGRYLEWSIAHSKRYVGIDLVTRYIEAGIERAHELGLSASTCQFVVGDAEKLDDIVTPELLGNKQSKALLFFPFNSFGNIESYSAVIGSIKRCASPFCISTYTTSPLSLMTRLNYFSACQYAGLNVRDDNQGTLFSTKSGLHSMAYHPHFLLSELAQANLAAETIQFAQIGIAYLTPGLACAS